MEKIDTTTPEGVVKFFETYWEELDLFKINNTRYLYLSDCNYSYDASRILFKKGNKLMLGLLREKDDDPKQKFYDIFEFTGNYLYFDAVSLTDINLYSHFEIR